MFKILLNFAVIVFMAIGAGSAFAKSKTGSFHGASDHVTTGDFTISKDADGSYVITLEDNFSLDGAPAPVVGFGKDGRYKKATEVGKLQHLKGKQSYKIPASVNIYKMNEVYIWCTKFGVPLGVAAIH
jgi:hypothetical protein